MYERMLNKQISPSFTDMISYCGDVGGLWMAVDEYLKDKYKVEIDMKRKSAWFIGITVLAICGFLMIRTFLVTKPFINLNSNDIAGVTVELVPPNIKFAIDDEAINELVSILGTVVTYQKDNSYGEYAGQMVSFDITKVNGETLKIQAYNPVIIINGVGYKTKYEPCEALNSFANNLRASKE